MTQDESLAYVVAAARLQGLPLSEARAHAVAVHLARTAQMAVLLESVGLLPEQELAEIYKPLPYESAP
jgi:Protein of unknown function (DUF4089)